MEPLTLLQKYKCASKAHAVYGEDNKDEPAKLVELAKAFPWGRAQQVSEAAGNHVLLFSYSSDDTPQLIRQGVRHELPGGRKLRRKARRGVELLVERAFVKLVGNNCEDQIVASFVTPHTW